MPSPHYLAFPALNRLAFDRQNPRLKPARLLRFWYLLQGEERLSRAEVLGRWTEALPHYHVKTLQGNLRAGVGVWWDLEGDQVVPRTPEALHREHQLPYSYQPRHRGALQASTQDWHRDQAEEAILQYQLGPDGKTDPIPRQELAAATGLRPRTLRALLAGSTRVRPVAQYVRVHTGESPQARRLLHRQYPGGFFRTIGRQTGLFRRLPDRFICCGIPSLQAGWKQSPLGRLVRNSIFLPLPHQTFLRDLWEGPSCLEEPTWYTNPTKENTSWKATETESGSSATAPPSAPSCSSTASSWKASSGSCGKPTSTRWLTSSLSSWSRMGTWTSSPPRRRLRPSNKRMVGRSARGDPALPSTNSPSRSATPARRKV